MLESVGEAAESSTSTRVSAAVVAMTLLEHWLRSSPIRLRRDLKAVNFDLAGDAQPAWSFAPGRGPALFATGHDPDAPLLVRCEARAFLALLAGEASHDVLTFEGDPAHLAPIAECIQIASTPLSIRTSE